MSLVTSLRPTVTAGRQLAADLGLRQRTLTIRTRTWSGGKLGAGTATNVDLAITPAPKISEPPARLVNDTGGQYRSGDVVVTKISRDTYTEAQLAPASVAGVEVVYLVGDGGGAAVHQYKLVGDPENLNFEWKLQLRHVNRAVS